VYCERDERPCQPHKNRCKNNATCNEFGIKYNCTCMSGFEGHHCEYNINDCVEGICQNGGQCEDLINGYKCLCLSMYYGDHCEFKSQALQMKENVSRSFSFFAIFIICLTYVFFLALDAMRYVFKIEPEGMSEQRQVQRRKKLIKKIMDDLRDKKKRKRYRKLIKSGGLQNQLLNDPFIIKLEKTFQISYDADLRYIDDESVLDLDITNRRVQSSFKKAKKGQFV
jgi:hypothetical protein